MREKVPEFCLPDQNNTVCLEDFRGRWVILYFYPRDNTKGCTMEATDFTENLEEFKKLDTFVIGVSPDSTKSHLNFAKKHGLKIILLSDPKHEVLEMYGVWKLKKNCIGESISALSEAPSSSIPKDTSDMYEGKLE